MASVRPSRTQASRPTISGALLLAVAVALLATVRQVHQLETAAAISVVAVALVVAGATSGLGTDMARPTGRPLWPVLIGLGFLFAGVGAIGEVGLGYGLLVAGLGGAALWTLANPRSMAAYRQWVIAAAAVAIVATIGVGAIAPVPDPAIDVVLINKAGAAALAEAENPYQTVSVPNTSPYAPPGATFDGYVYPPLALFTYSVSDWALGDTRWVNVLAAGLFVLLLVRPWRDKEPGIAEYAALGGLIIALLPDLTFLLRFGWTEPMALPFLALAILLWEERPVPSAVFLGLAVASKQYYILLALLLLLWNDEFRWRRVAIVGGVALATMVPFLIADPQAFWDAAIAPQFGFDPRPDSLNVIALGFTPPSWLAAAAGGTVAIVLGLRGGGGAEFALAAAAVLGVGFLFGSQAFANYWFLIIALCVLALVAKVSSTDRTRPDMELRTAHLAAPNPQRRNTANAGYGVE
ncbi:MAG: glycosyltransferase 87 family protein [Acidimicrobiia bacterium]|nr:glycosyltransferase 87 family protein [Acidimicrobiia bacterium]